MSIKFKRSESFYIRDGWFQKAIHAIYKSEENIFSKNRGVEVLGIGSNMVKGLKYWLTVSGIVETSSSMTKLSAFGELLLKYDPYLEDDFSWFLIHFNICRGFEDAPIFNYVFNKAPMAFEKNDMIQLVVEYIRDNGLTKDLKSNYVSEDMNVFLKTYTIEDREGNPEDNYICPLSSLELIEKKKDLYYKRRPKYGKLSYLVVYYSLLSIYKNEFTIEDSLKEDNGPVRLFNLDKNMLAQYLDEMKKEGLVTINKTAGLNTVYFEQKLKLEQIFKKYFGGKLWAIASILK